MIIARARGASNVSKNTDLVVLRHPVLVIAQVLQACARLQDLAGGWAPVGSLLEGARLALVGLDGLDEVQMRRLLRWAARWEAMDPRLRALYAQHQSAIAVDVALWHVLDQRSGQPSGVVYGKLRDLWVKVYGYSPSIELVPTITLNIKDQP
jgi:hypothetical protein